MNIKLFLSTIPLLLFQFSLAVDLPLPEGFTLVDSSSSYKMVLTPYATYPVTLEQYSPKIIIQGKWGTNPGEFSFEYYEDNEGMTKSIYPSMAVNSKGEIYILDIMNNRIQKFDNEGKHLKNIVVPIRADRNEKSIVHLSTKPYYVENSFEFDNKAYYYEKSKAYYYGINIAIDAQDTLYYYTHKGANKGEVWEFKDDILSNKHELPSKSFNIERSKNDGNVYAFDYEQTISPYDFIKSTFTDDTINKQVIRSSYTIHVNSKEKDAIEIINNQTKSILINLPQPNKKLLPFIDNCFILSDSRIRIYTTRWATTGDILQFDMTGKLCSIYIYPEWEKNYWRSYDKFGQLADEDLGNDGEEYMLFAFSEGLNFVRNEVVPIKR